jgi:polyisoprenoid-binding protein YceI
MHGVTKEVDIPFKYNGKIKDLMGNTRVAVEGSLTIDRRDWGITYSKALDNGGLIAGDDVKITLDIEAVKKQK